MGVVNMKKVEVLYTAIYPYDKDYFDLTEVLYRFTGNNVDILKRLIDLQDTYPDFYQWYLNKVVKDIKAKRNRRNILFAISDVLVDDNVEKRITGISILKANRREKKICTFRVFPEYRGQGVGRLLMKNSLYYLNTTKPLISIAENSLKAFSGFIDKYEWNLKEILTDYYKKGSKEYVFNGSLK